MTEEAPPVSPPVPEGPSAPAAPADRHHGFGCKKAKNSGAVVF